MDLVLNRLHQLLAEAIRERRPGAVNRPVTVAEIYQDLVPYRAVRDQLGIDMNADYEHALLRLLAGHHELLRLEPQHARDELAGELDSPNPNLGIYRKFAACDVWVTLPPVHAPASGIRDAAEPAGSVDPERDSAPAISFPAAATASPYAPPPTPAPPAPTPPMAATFAAASDPARTGAAVEPTVPRTSSSSATQTARPASCAFCAGPLPADRAVRYCPHCGEDQRRQPCTACGEVLEPDWRFCIACGTENRPADDDA